MATIEEAFVARTSTVGTIASLVSTRIYPLVVPQDISKPALAYQRLSHVPYRSHSGFSNLSRTRLQVTVEAASYTSARAIAAAVRSCWESFKGTAGGVSIEACFVENDSDGYDEARLAPVARIDLMLTHNGE